MPEMEATVIPPAVPFDVIARALIARLSTVTSSQLGILGASSNAPRRRAGAASRRSCACLRIDRRAIAETVHKTTPRWVWLQPTRPSRRL